MAMRETTRSLSAYFIISGLLGVAINAIALRRGGPLLGAIFDLVGLAICVAYLYIGVRLRHLLRAAPRQIVGVLAATFVLLAVILAVAVTSGAIRETWPTVLIGGLVTWYLYANVKRLIAEAELNPAVVPGGA